jgi:hypothetical protein
MDDREFMAVENGSTAVVEQHRDPGAASSPAACSYVSGYVHQRLCYLQSLQYSRASYMRYRKDMAHLPRVHDGPEQQLWVRGRRRRPVDVRREGVRPTLGRCGGGRLTGQRATHSASQRVSEPCSDSQEIDARHRHATNCTSRLS